MHFSTRRRVQTLGLALALAGLVVLPIAAQHEQVDLDAMYRIKQEGFQNSQVMEILSYLTDVYGPRLTNSPTYRQGGDWAMKEMTSWGLTNVKLEPWGPFGSGWENERTMIMAVSPQKFPLYLFEMQFRYNHRREDLFQLLLQALTKPVPDV